MRSLAEALMADATDDIVQQTYFQVLTQGTGPVRHPRAWLGRIVRSIVSNMRRGRERRLYREHTVSVAELVPSSHELMEREERRSALVRAVDGLPDHLRAVVLLRFFENHPPRIVARELRVPVSVVKERLRSAIDRLRQHLDQNHDGSMRAWLLPLLPSVAVPFRKCATLKRLAELATKLGVSHEALKALGTGWDLKRRVFTFPERDGHGRVIGIGTRAPDGRKWFLKGGKRGLIVPRDWPRQETPHLLVEGPSDLAAAWTLGLSAIGRPHAQGGVPHLAELLRDCPVLVIGENDSKPNGGSPGRSWATGRLSVSVVGCSGSARPVYSSNPTALFLSKKYSFTLPTRSLTMVFPSAKPFSGAGVRGR